jgi:catechol 2,3-dioxygenase-like lactoylglutathione lyase family enzyme
VTTPPPSPYRGAEAVAVLPAADLDRAEAWYGRLGFTVLGIWEGYRILRAGDFHLHLAGSDHEPGASTSAVYLYVDDVDAVHAAWAAAGVTILDGLHDREWAMREFAAQDPDGNLWRVGTRTDRGGPEGATLGAAGAPRSEAAPGEAGSGSVGAEPPADGSPGTSDQHWLTIVGGPEACAGCGFDPATAVTAALSDRLRDSAYRWRQVLLDADDVAVRARPAAGTWSALEYGVHVRDTVAVFTERILRTLAEDGPELGWWDHEAAVEDGFANESDVEAVLDDLDDNVGRLREVLGRVHDEQWSRRATRRAEEDFTVELLARFVAHEVAHHLADAERGLTGP